MPVEIYQVTEGDIGQRLDNFLIRHYKGVPKSRLYRAIRRGEVRINKSRAKADSRLSEGDELRLPPLRQGEKPSVLPPSKQMQGEIESRILVETPGYIVIQKPSGIPVHGGSGVSLGLIEALRQMRPKQKFLELVHRLDKETSGCLLIAKRRRSLVELQNWFRSGLIKKRYWVLVKGEWEMGIKRCDFSLKKNQLSSGERMVRVDRLGKEAVTIFRPIQQYGSCTLLEATLKTGRTHQIRVHLQALGHPVVGDTKYGDKNMNQVMRHRGLNRLFLQSVELSYRDHETLFGVCSLLDEELVALLKQLK